MLEINDFVTTSDIGAVDDTWKTQGIIQTVNDFTTLIVYVDLTANDSTDNQLQIAAALEGVGTPVKYQPESTSYRKTLGDDSISIVYEFDIQYFKYLYIQTKATVVGATEGTVTIDLIYIKE